MDWETDKREGRRALIGHDGLPFIMGFSLLSMSEFFVFRKMETCETKNHPLCGCESRSYTKSPFRFIIEVSKPLSKKGKVIYMAKKANDLAHTKVQFTRDYTG